MRQSRVYIGIGSSVDRERHVRLALDCLADRYGEIDVSSVFESEAVGFDGDAFLNLVVGIRTHESVAELAGYLKDVEARYGRRPGQPRYSPRTLDLDILTFDDRVGVFEGVVLPRAEILHNAFVLWPLSELAPRERHPETGRTYQELWADYQRDQVLWPVTFDWRGHRISPRPGPA